VRRLARYALFATAGALVLTGCNLDPTISEEPQCSSLGRPGSPAVVLMAQAVPTAQLLPCVAVVPVGWAIGSFSARDGRAHFVLDSDLAGAHAVDVVVTRSCDVRGATRVPSDQPTADRYERVSSLTDGYRGTRYYVYPGGCTSYVFALHGAARAAPVNDVSLAVTFVTRTQLRASVREASDGALRLDP
jgi:hypothetical protein